MRQSKSEKKLARVPFRVSRLMEFCNLRELTNQTGHDCREWPLVILKECIDNGLDNCEEHGVAPVICVTVAPGVISIEDNGSGISSEIIGGVIDYGVRVSSREAYCSPTRGAQGNALKTILAMGYVLDEARGDDACGHTTIEALGVAHDIEFTVDHIRQQPQINHRTKPSLVKQGTRITVRLPHFTDLDLLKYCESSLARICNDYLWVNPHLAFRLIWNDKVIIDEAATDPLWCKWTPSRPTSAHWYDFGRLQRYMAAHIAHRETITVREFVSEFYGMSGSAKQKQVLADTGASHLKLIDFFGRTKINKENISKLLQALQKYSRKLRPDILGVIGEAHFRARIEAAGGAMEAFKYRYTIDEIRGIPHVSEFAFAPHRDGLVVSDRAPTRKLVAGVNWSASVGSHPFRQLGRSGQSLDGVMADLHANASQPVIAVLHHACPRVTYTDRGKSSIAIEG